MCSFTLEMVGRYLYTVVFADDADEQTQTRV